MTKLTGAAAEVVAKLVQDKWKDRIGYFVSRTILETVTDDAAGMLNVNIVMETDDSILIKLTCYAPKPARPADE